MFERLAHHIATPIWLLAVIRRNRVLRLFLTAVILGGSVVVYFAGWQGLLTAVALLGRIGFAIVFIVIQFVAMFWFLSRSKAVEVHPGDDKTITFDDYWGQEHVVAAVKQWTKLLSDRGRFDEMGGKTLSGILLYGPPGTGKTFLARAMAGDGGVAFYGVEGSSFRAMFMGVGVMKVMQFFKKCRELAKEYGACIGYLDEIDAIGGSRGGVMESQPVDFNPTHKMMMGMGMGMGSMELTRLLFELDGLGEISLRDTIENKVRAWFGLKEIDQGRVLIMGATNRPDALDPALKRPGRLDKMIELDRPDRKSREQIIRGYLAKINHDPEISIGSLVEDTPHATPAQIMSAITKDAVRRAFFDTRTEVTQEDIELALQDQVLGLANPIADWDETQQRQVAVHEAGHAVASHLLNPHKRLVRVSIIRRSGALGYVLPVDKTDIYAMPLEHLVTNIMVSLAGHEATKIAFGKYWTGATGDFANVRRQLNGLIQLGYFGTPPMIEGVYTDTQLDQIYEFLDQCTTLTVKLLEENWEIVEAISYALLQRKDLAGHEVVEIIEEVQNGNENTV